MSTEERLISKKELSSYLKISISTIDRLRKAGRLKCIAVGGSIRFDKKDLFTSNNQS